MPTPCDDFDELHALRSEVARLRQTVGDNCETIGALLRDRSALAGVLVGQPSGIDIAPIMRAALGAAIPAGHVIRAGYVGPAAPVPDLRAALLAVLAESHKLTRETFHTVADALDASSQAGEAR